MNEATTTLTRAEAVQIVIRKALAAGAAHAAGRGDGHVVAQAQDVAHGVVAVGQVLEAHD